MESNEENQGKKNVSRHIFTIFILLLGAFVALIVSMLTIGGGAKEARDQKRKAEEEARAEKVVASPVPSAKDAAKLLEQQISQAKQELSTNQQLTNVPPPINEDVARRLANLDLGEIDRQAREAAQRRLAQQTQQMSEIMPGVRRGAESAMAMPEVFDVGQKKPLVNQAVEDKGTKDARQRGKTRLLDEDPLDQYEVTRPKAAPTRYLLSQGSVIDVVLNSEVNTQNPGLVQMRVVSDVYDSMGKRQLLIPKGSKILASYDQSSSRSGLDRIPLMVTRILFADGRSIDLSSTSVSDTMGNAGAPAEHHSNLLRAIGPSALVAWLGYEIDKTVGVTAVPSTNQQLTAAQSISQQVVPKIEERIASRFGAALPYYTIEAGTRLTIVLGQDLSIPPYNGGVQ